MYNFTTVFDAVVYFFDKPLNILGYSFSFFDVFLFLLLLSFGSFIVRRIFSD